MSIRYKLLASYIAMTLVPLILMILASMIIYIILWGNNMDVRQMVRDSKQLEFKQGAAFGELQQTAKLHPEQLLDTEFQHDLNAKLGAIGAEYIIIKQDAVAASSPSLGPASKVEALDKETASSNELKIGSNTYRADTVNLKFADQAEGKLVYLRDSEPIPMYLRPVMFTLVLLALAFTSAVLTYLVSRNITRPIYALKKAALEIKNGNLNFEVKPTTNDEIGELGIAFEEMRRRLKESIDHSLQEEENRKELISNISHDLKTPITAIKGYVEGVLDGVANTPEKKEKYYRTIYKKASDMDKLIDELFLFSMLDVRSIPFHFQSIDLQKFMSDYLEEQKFILEKQQISLEVPQSEDVDPVLMVIADREKLGRALSNIIENSIKYMDRTPAHNSKIIVQFHEMDDTVQVEIRDNGQGIDPESLPYIFDRFYRTEKSRNTQTGGSGLGLSIVKQIIEGHGGSVWAQSAVSEGTSLFFTLKKDIPENRVADYEKNINY